MFLSALYIALILPAKQLLASVFYVICNFCNNSSLYLLPIGN